MVGAVPGTLAAPHIVPSNNKLRLATNGELDFRDVNLADMEPEVVRVSHENEVIFRSL